MSNSRNTGGVIIFVKKPIKYQILLNESIDYRLWCIAIEILDCTIKGIFCGMYRSPSYNLSETIDPIDKIFDKIINLLK